MSQMTEKPPVGLRFGALCDPIQKQLRAQGLTAPMPTLREWQRAADAITYLHLHGYLAPARARVCRARLLKTIATVAHD